MGIIKEYEVLVECKLQLWFERVGTPSWGLFGGGDGAAPDVSVTLPGQKKKKIFKVNAMKIPAGTKILVKTGGGGGWGKIWTSSSSYVNQGYGFLGNAGFVLVRYLVP